MTDADEPYNCYLPTDDHRTLFRSLWSKGYLRATVAADVPYYRVQRASNVREASHRARQTFASPSFSRFTPVSRSGTVLASSYVGDSARVALWETVLRNLRHAGRKIVTSDEVRERYLVELRLREYRQLIDLRRPGISNLAINRHAPDLSAAWPGDYAITRAWAQMMVEEADGAQGIVYESHQIAGVCTVFFGEWPEDLFEVVADPVAVWLAEPQRILITEAAKAGAAVDFADIVDPAEDEDD